MAQSKASHNRNLIRPDYRMRFELGANAPRRSSKRQAGSKRLGQCAVRDSSVDILEHCSANRDESVPTRRPA